MQTFLLSLGNLFLATRRTLIDVQRGELIIRVQNEQVTFNVFKAMKLPTKTACCFRMDVIGELVGKMIKTKRLDDNPEAGLVRSLMTTMFKYEEDNKIVTFLEASPLHPYRKTLPLDEINPSKPHLVPSIKKPPILELKPLPSHLRYVYLGESSTLPVIIDASLN